MTGATTHRLGDVRESLLAERDDLVDEVAGLDPENPAYADRVERGGEIDTHLDGIEYLIDDHGADATVTVRGLDAGTFARLEDDLHEATGGVTGPGAARNYTVAHGVPDAPFYPPDADTDDVEPRLAAVARLPVPVVKWLKSEVDEATGVGGNERRRFGELLQERRDSETSTGTSSSTTPSGSP